MQNDSNLVKILVADLPTSVFKMQQIKYQGDQMCIDWNNYSSNTAYFYSLILYREYMLISKVTDFAFIENRRKFKPHKIYKGLKVWVFDWQNLITLYPSSIPLTIAYEKNTTVLHDSL